LDDAQTGGKKLLDEQLPVALIEKLVKARVKKNDEAEKKK